MWQALVGPIVGLVKSHITNKAEEKQAVHKAKLTKLEQDGVWEITQAESSLNSWKDEYLLLILSIPMVGSFIPSMVPHIVQGFVVLDGMPDYYKGFLGAAVGASFGIKALSKWGSK
jgi:hypothetical protein